MKIFKSKTINFSILLAAMGMLEMHLHLVQEQLGDNYGIVYIVVAVIVAVLRAVTTKPLSEK